MAYRLTAEAEFSQMAGTYMNDLATMVGFLAGLVTTAANLPQVWKTYRNRSAEGLSFRLQLRAVETTNFERRVAECGKFVVWRLARRWHD
jgi:hypothetical protein